MHFRVQYRTDKGRLATIAIEADTEVEAREKSGQPVSRILSVSPDLWAHLKETLLYPAPAPTEQALFLQNLSALLLSGEDVSRAIHRLLTGNVALKYDPKKITACITCVDYLKALRFNTVAVTLAEVGERSAALGETLQTAANNLLEREKMLKDLGKSLWQSFIYAGIGLGLLFGLPLFLGGVLETFMNESGVVFNANIWTHFTLGVRHFLLNYWPEVVIGLVSLVVFRRPIWGFLQDRKGWRLIRDFILLKRGLFFLTAYKSLYQAGISDPKSVLLIQSQANRTEKTIYEAMYRNVTGGKDLATAMDTPHWPLNLRFSIANFSSLQDEKRTVLVNTLISTLHHQIEIVSQQAARMVTTLSWICIILGIASVAIGYYLPMATMKPGF